MVDLCGHFPSNFIGCLQRENLQKTICMQETQEALNSSVFSLNHSSANLPWAFQNHRILEVKKKLFTVVSSPICNQRDYIWKVSREIWNSKQPKFSLEMVTNLQFTPSCGHFCIQPPVKSMIATFVWISQTYSFKLKNLTRLGRSLSQVSWEVGLSETRSTCPESVVYHAESTGASNSAGVCKLCQTHSWVPIHV